jgi:hypothetical protein
MRMHRDHLRFHLLQLLFRRPWVRVTLGPSSSSLRIKIDCRRRRWTPTLWSESLPPLTSPQLSPDPLRMEGRCDLPRWRLRGSNGQLKVSIALTTNSNSLCIYFWSSLVPFRFGLYLFFSLHLASTSLLCLPPMRLNLSILFIVTIPSFPGWLTHSCFMYYWFSHAILS